jgi:hypothetical protein
MIRADNLSAGAAISSKSNLARAVPVVSITRDDDSCMSPYPDIAAVAASGHYKRYDQPINAPSGND